jgi:hypothetical protein
VSFTSLVAPEREKVQIWEWFYERVMVRHSSSPGDNRLRHLRITAYVTRGNLPSSPSDTTFVTPGLDPGVHCDGPSCWRLLEGCMDCRIKSGNDEGRGEVFGDVGAVERSNDGLWGLNRLPLGLYPEVGRASQLGFRSTRGLNGSHREASDMGGTQS